MLEGLVAWVLNNYLGKYVENLNTDQLSVALLSGKVELENLPLKKDALRHLGLPVEVKTGFIGKVQLQVPVRQIRSAPWLIAIEKLYVVVTPVNLDEVESTGTFCLLMRKFSTLNNISNKQNNPVYTHNSKEASQVVESVQRGHYLMSVMVWWRVSYHGWDSEVEANIAHERKVALLDALEAQWRADHEACDAGYYATSYSSWLSYGTGLLANIVENLQLKLYDVHIRYEDALTCAPCAFACGLTVEALTAESCDERWRRGFTLLSDTDGCSFKLLELQRLAVYWDPVEVPGGMYAGCVVPELTERMGGSWRAPHRYVVAPAGARARVRRERTGQPLRSRTRPRLACHLALDAVTLNLASKEVVIYAKNKRYKTMTCVMVQWQYDGLVGCAAGLARIARVREYRALRPAAPVRGHARRWWLYALSCHVREHPWTEPKPSWSSCVERARQTRRYVDTCASMLANPAAALPPDDKRAKDEFEYATPLYILKALREAAMRKVPKSTPVSTPEKPGGSGRSMLVHWFPQWWGWYGNPDAPAPAPAPSPSAPSPAPAPELEEEILDVLADSIENNTLLKRDTVFGKFEFELSKGSLNLSTEDEADLEVDAAPERAPAGVTLQYSGVRACVEARPRGGSLALRLALGAVSLRERLTPRTLYPVLVAPQGMIREGLSGLNAACAGPAPPPSPAQEPLFQLTYEKKPFGVNVDYKSVSDNLVAVRLIAGAGRPESEPSAKLNDPRVDRRRKRNYFMCNPQ
ncbi:unnamed protein product [Diatraea saccharalis]|uniref:Chorein N-terminal domain-containing protein n=1 Tax=Diatraea saccharalis TaxID=40085 RepID=A0A9N9QUC3_9NEOP|nr:unnamed protein product [Diatraea saccharalis]